MKNLKQKYVFFGYFFTGFFLGFHISRLRKYVDFPNSDSLKGSHYVQRRYTTKDTQGYPHSCGAGPSARSLVGPKMKTRKLENKSKPLNKYMRLCILYIVVVLVLFIKHIIKPCAVVLCMRWNEKAINRMCSMFANEKGVTPSVFQRV